MNSGTTSIVCNPTGSYQPCLIIGHILVERRFESPMMYQTPIGIHWSMRRVSWLGEKMTHHAHYIFFKSFPLILVSLMAVVISLFIINDLCYKMSGWHNRAIWFLLLRCWFISARIRFKLHHLNMPIYCPITVCLKIRGMVISCIYLSEV